MGINLLGISKSVVLLVSLLQWCWHWCRHWCWCCIGIGVGGDGGGAALARMSHYREVFGSTPSANSFFL